MEAAKELPELKKMSQEAKLTSLDAKDKAEQAEQRNAAQDAELAALRGAVESLAKVPAGSPRRGRSHWLSPLRPQPYCCAGGEACRPAAAARPCPCRGSRAPGAPPGQAEGGPVRAGQVRARPLRPKMRLSILTLFLPGYCHRVKSRLGAAEGQLKDHEQRLQDLAALAGKGPAITPQDLENLRRELKAKAAKADVDHLADELRALMEALKVGDSGIRHRPRSCTLHRPKPLPPLQNKADKSDLEAALAALGSQHTAEPITVTVPSGDSGAASQDLINALNGQAARLKALEGLVAVLTGRVDGKADKAELDGLRTELKRLRERLDQAEHDLNHRIDGIDGTVDNLTNRLGDLQTSVGGLNNRLIKTEAEVGRLGGDVAGAKHQISELDNRKADRSELESLKDALSKLPSGKGGDLDSRLAALDAEIHDVKNHILLVAYGLLLTSVGEKASKAIPNYQPTAPSSGPMGTAVGIAVEAAKESAAAATSGTATPAAVSRPASAAPAALKPAVRAQALNNAATVEDAPPNAPAGGPAAGAGAAAGAAAPAAAATHAPQSSVVASQQTGATVGPAAARQSAAARPVSAAGARGSGAGTTPATASSVAPTPEPEDAGLTFMPFAASQQEETLVMPGGAKKSGAAMMTSYKPAPVPVSRPVSASPSASRPATPVDLLRDMITKGDVKEKCDKDALKKLAKWLDENAQFKGSDAPGDNAKALWDLVRRLQRDIDNLKKNLKNVELQPMKRLPDGDYAMLSSKPLFGYRCMSCDRPLDKLESQPGYYVPSELFPTRRVDGVQSRTNSPPKTEPGSPERAASPPPRRPASSVGIRQPAFDTAVDVPPGSAASRKDMVPAANWFKESHGGPMEGRPAETGPHLPPGGWRGQGEHAHRDRISQPANRMPPPGQASPGEFSRPGTALPAGSVPASAQQSPL